jgi:hypothetical protein
MNRLLVACAIVWFLAHDAFAGGPCSGVPGGCGRSRYRSSASGGTVHVKGYTRKDGTYVSPHARRSACSGCNETKTRTSPRTTARTRTWGGTGSASDDKSLYAPVPTTEDIEASRLENERKNEIQREIARRAAEEAKRQAKAAEQAALEAKRQAEIEEKLRHRYIMHLASGGKRDIYDYEEDGETYIVTTLGGGRTRYKKSLIRAFEPISHGSDRPITPPKR